MPKLPSELSYLLNPSDWGLDGPDARYIVLAIGLILVLFGSRFYKLVLVTPGFVGGVLVAIEYAPAANASTKAVVAVVAGIAGAGALLYMERLALGAVGAMIFGGLAVVVAPMIVGGATQWWMYAAPALVGAFIVPFVYKRSLRIITPIIGAVAIGWAIDRPTDPGILIGFTALGVVIQHTLTGKK
jgi:hypothetical protein